MKPVVAHIVDHYLPRTQTFIHGYLSSFSATEPVVFAHTAENPERFPVDRLEMVERPEGLRRVADKAAYLVGHRRPARDRRYRDAVRDAGARVLHGHFGWSAPVTLPLKRDTGLPLVTTFYGRDVSALPRQRDWRRLYDELFACGDTFFVEGGHMRQRLAELGCPAGRIEVHHIGVDLASIPFAERTAPESGPLTVLMCSSFVEKKGIPYGIEAFATVLRESGAARGGGGLRLVLAGDGPLRAEIEALVDRLGVRDSVDLLGYVDHGGFIDLCREAHVFLAPSVAARDGDTEGGAPTTILEASASGLPVVATTHADIPEVVRDGESGVLVPERDSDALAAALAGLLGEPERWAAFGRAGREHVARGYDLPVVVARMERAYLGLLGEAASEGSVSPWTSRERSVSYGDVRAWCCSARS